MKKNIQFINVDLEFICETPLDLIRDEVKPQLYDLYTGPLNDEGFKLVLEAETKTVSPDQTINFMCDALETLSIEAKEKVNSCSSIVFDIGYDSGFEPFHITHELKTSTLKRIVALEAKVKVTIYSVDKT